VARNNHDRNVTIPVCVDARTLDAYTSQRLENAAQYKASFSKEAWRKLTRKRYVDPRVGAHTKKERPLSS
jgi:hypothetical protein